MVATAFTKGLTVLPGVDLYGNRRREDKNSLEILGITIQSGSVFRMRHIAIGFIGVLSR